MQNAYTKDHDKNNIKTSNFLAAIYFCNYYHIKRIANTEHALESN